MSIPLPHVYHISSKNEVIKNTESSKKSGININVNDLYLSAEERYEIFEIKAAERPHLLYYNPSLLSSSCTGTGTLNEKDEKKSCDTGEDDSTVQNNLQLHDPPLIDGCDIPGWRKDDIVTGDKYIDSNHNVLTINSEVQALLNIGPSSKMFRLESQWPNIDKLIQSSNHRWKQLRKKLTQEPPISDSADIVEYDEYCQLINVNDNENKNHQERKSTKFAIKFEQRNIPAKIMGATLDWKCMPKDQWHKESWT